MAAKLQHPLLLCNDINLKTLISVVNEDENHILITCKDFVKRYNLVDRKQVNSWITRSWDPFTAGAVKDNGSNLIFAIANNTHLWQWSVEAVDLEKVKQHSFKSPIHRLITGNKGTYILYSSGYIERFNDKALKQRKEIKADIINKDDEILESQIYEDKKLAVLFLRNKEGCLSICKFQLGSHRVPESYNISLGRCYLTGSCLASSGKLLTTWSDGNLYNQNILNEVASTHPGHLQGSLKPIKRTKHVKILELLSTHIAIQGMDASEEGGLVLLWDIKFGFISSSKPLKMYNDPPLAWNLGSGIVVGDGGSLAFIPVELVPSTVASVFGSRISEDNGNSEEYSGIWTEHFSEKNKNFTKVLPKETRNSFPTNTRNKLQEIFLKFQNSSMTQDIVVDLAVEYIIEKKNLELLSAILSEIEAIPENSLVTILKHLLETPDEHYESIKYRTDKKSMISGVDVNCGQNSIHKNTLSSSFGFIDDASVEEYKAQSPFLEVKSSVINQVLIKPFTKSHLSNSLKKLGFTNSFALIQYLHYLLATGKVQVVSVESDEVPSMEKTSLWLCLLLDSNYHQLVLTSEMEIHKKFLTCLSDVATLHSFLEASVIIDTLSEKILLAESMPTTSQTDSQYSIERLVIS